MLKSMDLLAECNAKSVSKTFAKGVGVTVSDKSYYSLSIQQIAEDYDDLLKREDASGIMVLDSRAPYQNSRAHRLGFTVRSHHPLLPVFVPGGSRSSGSRRQVR
jgi:hypothetical protein